MTRVVYVPKGTVCQHPARTGVGFIHRPAAEDSLMVYIDDTMAVIPMSQVWDARYQAFMDAWETCVKDGRLVRAQVRRVSRVKVKKEEPAAADFLDEILAERTRSNPRFARLVRKAPAKLKTARDKKPKKARRV